ncbi:hypothetical protein ACRYCC_09455 [Actinomadura scrupuli]|uniref:hypothetical protein n=1 Tax=Actinomadura scrupuli TaxID=559629 RepID=UPI003D984E58
MDHELVGLRAQSSRWRPVAGGAFGLLSFGVALLPIRPGWLWLALIVAANLAPWGIGYLRGRHPAPYWRLSQAGLERIARDGTVKARYERQRIEEFALTADDGMLTIFHKFGRTEVGELTEMGFEQLSFFLTARRLDIPVHVLDGNSSVLDDDDAPPPGMGTEQLLLDQEAELLGAGLGRTETDRIPFQPAEGDGEAVRLESAPPVPSRGRTAALGVLIALLGLTMAGRVALQGTTGFADRLAAGCWVLVAASGAVMAGRRLLRSAPVRWDISAAELRVGPVRLAAQDVAAVVTGPGVVADPLTGEPHADPLCALAFGHRLQLLARLPVRGLDAFQLVHALDEHGYRVITLEPRALRPSEYGLDGLPEIFAQVPGGRLIVVDDGLGWADAAGDVVLKMPADRIGGVELLTIDGHAWLRVYDSDGDEFFAAPLSALRISRTDLREQARRAGLPITDAEYDAYLSAAFHGAVSGLATVPEPEPILVVPGEGPGALLDATRRSRLWAYAVTAGVCELVALLGAFWLGGELGGFWPTFSWLAPLGLLLGLVGAWLYDRNRSQLRISALEIASVTRLGKVEWSVGRATVGGVGIDDSEEGLPRLVVWSPAGRVLRRVSFPPDLGQLREACERYGLPWGPPDAGHPAPPPPEL